MNPPPIAPAWTLFHEIAFYSLFVTLIINKRIGFAVFGIWAALILLNFKYAPESDRTAFNVYFSLHNLNFFIGMAAYAIYRKATPIVCKLLFCIGLVLLFFVANFPMVSAFAELRSITYAVGFGCLISGLASLESQYVKINIPLASTVGDASYTIYLLHLALQGLLLKITLGLHMDTMIGRSGVYILTLSGSLVFGCLIYMYIERPMLLALRRFWKFRSFEKSDRSLQSA